MSGDLPCCTISTTSNSSELKKKFQCHFGGPSMMSTHFFYIMFFIHIFACCIKSRMNVSSMSKMFIVFFFRKKINFKQNFTLIVNKFFLYKFSKRRAAPLINEISWEYFFFSKVRSFCLFNEILHSIRPTATTHIEHESSQVTRLCRGRHERWEI